MEIKKIDSTTTRKDSSFSLRPNNFSEFVGQEHIKGVIQTAIHSAQKRQGSMGHILFAGPSGFGKTTMAHIISQQTHVGIKTVTGYAISKPSEIVSMLNSLEEGDILFIDEIHRLKPTVEEVLYIAMEDFVIDMVMPEGGSVRIPINPFTLIGATTRAESLSQPLKNRFVYNFYFMEYTEEEKKNIIQRYFEQYDILFTPDLLELVSKKVAPVPREIHNLAVKVRDFLISKNEKRLTPLLWSDFLDHSRIDDGGMTPLHKQYLDILCQYDRPIGAKTIAAQLGVSEKALEEDIEPLLLKLGKIEKTAQGRMISL